MVIGVLVIGYYAYPPTPNPQSPIPNPQSPIIVDILFFLI